MVWLYFIYCDHRIWHFFFTCKSLQLFPQWTYHEFQLSFNVPYINLVQSFLDFRKFSNRTLSRLKKLHVYQCVTNFNKHFQKNVTRHANLLQHLFFSKFSNSLNNTEWYIVDWFLWMVSSCLSKAINESHRNIDNRFPCQQAALCDACSTTVAK